MFVQIDDRYEINREGHLRDITTGKLQFGSDDGYGYLKFTTRTNGKKACPKVHKLLALAFIPNPRNLPVINHKDGNKRNNSLDNLEWCSYADNLKHAIDNKLLVHKLGEEIYCAKLSEKSVLEIRQDFINNPRKSSYKDWSNFYSVAPDTIRKIIKGKTWKHI